MAVEKREFQGVFVPAALFVLMEARSITPTDLVMYLNIASFQRAGRECHMSNEKLGAKIGVQKRQAQNIVLKLINMGLVRSEFREDPNQTGVKMRFLQAMDPAQYSAPPHVKNCVAPHVKNCYIIDPSGLTSNNTPTRQAGGLLPTAVLTPPEPAPPTPPTSARFQRKWLKMWEAKYGKPYLFTGAKDGAILKKLHAMLKGDYAEFKAAVRRYLDNDFVGYRGHSLSGFIASIQKWTVPAGVEPGSEVSEPNEIEVTTRFLSPEEDARLYPDGTPDV